MLAFLRAPPKGARVRVSFLHLELIKVLRALIDKNPKAGLLNPVLSCTAYKIVFLFLYSVEEKGRVAQVAAGAVGHLGRFSGKVTGAELEHPV